MQCKSLDRSNVFDLIGIVFRSISTKVMWRFEIFFGYGRIIGRVSQNFFREMARPEHDSLSVKLNLRVFSKNSVYVVRDDPDWLKNSLVKIDRTRWCGHARDNAR